MRELKFYLSEAQDFIGGHQATERLIALYTQNPAKAEQMWKDALNAYKKECDLEEFEKLLETNGLYVQYDLNRRVLNYSTVFEAPVGEPYFSLRVYPALVPLGKLAVLKLIIPNNSHFIDVSK